MKINVHNCIKRKKSIFFFTLNQKLLLQKNVEDTISMKNNFNHLIPILSEIKLEKKKN